MITQETVQAVADEIYAVLKRHGVSLAFEEDYDLRIEEYQAPGDVYVWTDNNDADGGWFDATSKEVAP